MKLALPRLPDGWGYKASIAGTHRVHVRRDVHRNGEVFGWTFVCLGLASVCSCSGLISLLGWAPLVVLGGVWLYRLLWLVGGTEVWHLAHGTLRVDTSLGVISGTPIEWRSARILVTGPSQVPWELRLDGEGGRYSLHRSEQLDEVLGLAALISERTGWEIKYEELEATFRQALDAAIEARDVSRLKLFLEHPASIRLLAQELRQGRPQEQLVDLLAQCERAAPSLIESLAAEDQGTQTAAIDLLVALGCQQAVSALRGLLREGPGTVRETAAIALGRLQDGGSIPELRWLLEDTEPVAAAAACALGLLRDQDSIRVLCDLLDVTAGSPDPDVRCAAAVALGQIGDWHAAPWLGRALREDPAPAVRAAAADSLGQISDSRSVSVLCDALSDQDGEVAVGAAAALGAIGKVEAVPSLCYALESGLTNTRVKAARALAQISSDEQVIEALCFALENPAEVVRQEAALALGVTAERGADPLGSISRALPLLRKLSSPLSLETAKVKRACREALRSVETCVARAKDLPLPAGPHAPASETLPRPSDRDG